jgi:hypothetical protein
MASVKSIYLDDEAIKILDDKKITNSDFNLSQFIQDSLKRINIKPKLTYDEICGKLREYKVKLIQVKSEIDFLEDEKLKIEVQQQQKKIKEVEIKERDYKKQKDIKDSRINDFMYFYKGINKETAKILSDEFEPVCKTTSMFDFLENKGYVSRTVEETNDLDQKLKEAKRNE